MDSLRRKLADLETMTPVQLRALWRDCWRKPAPEIGPDLLRRGIAWKLQSRVHGELAISARKEIGSALDRLRKGDDVISERTASLRPGTRLVREWGGKAHHILVLEEGYEHEGRRYTSLTQIAFAITGAHWSGPVFFGVKKRRSVPFRPAA